MSALQKPYVSKSSMFWKTPDPAVTEARKQAGWPRFHRECGRAGLYFDEIEKSGRGFRAITFRAQKNRQGGYLSFLVSEGQGTDPASACVDALEKAAAGGFQIDTAIAAELTRATAEITKPVSAPVMDDELMALIGGIPAEIAAAVGYEDLIG